MHTVKILKFRTPKKFAVITLKVEQDDFSLEKCIKRCSQNCKQCRPWSDCSSRSCLIWVCTVCPDLSVRKLRNITVTYPYFFLPSTVNKYEVCCGEIKSPDSCVSGTESVQELHIVYLKVHKKHKRAEARQNQQNDLWAQWRLRSAWASTQFDQSSLSAWRKLTSLASHLSAQRRLIRLADASCTCHFFGFVMRRLNL